MKFSAIENFRSSVRSGDRSTMNPIDISSSDNDSDKDDNGEVTSSARDNTMNVRQLPSWASNAQRHETGLHGKFHPLPGTGHACRTTTENNFNDSEKYSGAILSKPSSELQKGGHHSSGSRNLGIPWGFPNSIKFSEGSATKNPDTVSYFGLQEAKIRILPSTLQAPVPHIRSRIPAVKRGIGLSCNEQTDIHLGNTSFTNNAGNVPIYSSRGVFGTICNESRIIPSSMEGKHSAIDFGVIGESTAENDERHVFEAALQGINQPKSETDVTRGLLSVSLLRHQKIALTWMIQKETRSLNCTGGILADDQGLGKTVSMIALLQMQRHLQRTKLNYDSYRIESVKLDDDPQHDEDVLEKEKQDVECGKLHQRTMGISTPCNFSPKRPVAGTLVICPASILRQWARELNVKVANESKLTILIYHGGNREKDPVKLVQYDVVLTTYSIVTNDFPDKWQYDDDEMDGQDKDAFCQISGFSSKKRKKSGIPGRKRSSRKEYDTSDINYDGGPLARVIWFRVVLDEAQTIKNPRTRVAKACCAIRAKRRWCLSGTPIQNSIDDLYSYFRFLRYVPYDKYRKFFSSIKMRINKDSSNGYLKLQAILGSVMLRRTKDTMIDGECIVKLPSKKVSLTQVDFSAEERTFYSKLEAESRSKFKAYTASGTVRQNYGNILLLLLRLRQACDHPLLVKGFRSESMRRISAQMAASIPEDMKLDLLSQLEMSSAFCLICKDMAEDGVVSMCRHVFCYQCVCDYLSGETCPAPNCTEQLGPDIMFSSTTLRGGVDILESPPHGNSIMESGFRSAKIRAVLDILESHCCSGEEGKAIIFSQWNGMLGLVELFLNENCIQYRRFDGSMTLSSRDRAVKAFDSDPEVVVLLMSLKAGNVGLNLVTASLVILLDLWWNPTTEDQAIDRAHRIGQTRPVTVSRITIRDTIEDKILALQEKKKIIAEAAFGGAHNRESCSLTREDLQFLFDVHD